MEGTSIITTISPYDAHLRLLYIHGFLGRCDRTFKGLMEPLATHMERERQFKNVRIDLHPYNYETKGVYRQAPWELVQHLEQLDQDWRDIDRNDEVPNFVVILAHSIGGLVAADAIQILSKSPVGNNTKVIGLVAFDTPFFSIDTTFFEMALDDLQRRSWDVVFRLVRARIKPGIRADVAVGNLERYARLNRPIFINYIEFFAFMLSGMSASMSSNMVSELFQKHTNADTATCAASAGTNTSTGDNGSVPRHDPIQFMAELLETMTHRERFIDLINNTHVHFRCYYNKMHMPLIRLPLNDPLFMRFFKPFEWATDPSAKHPSSGCVETAIAHTQMLDPRHNKNIDWLVNDVSHLVISMLGRALDNGHQQQQYVRGDHPQDLPSGLYPSSSLSSSSSPPPPPPLSSAHCYSNASFLNTPPPALPLTTPKPLPARSRTVLRLSTAPVPAPSPTFKSNFTLNRSNAILYRKNRRCSTSSTSSTSTSSTSKSLPTPQDSPTLDLFPIAYNPIQGGQHPT